MTDFEDILARAFIAEDPLERFTALREELGTRMSALKAMHLEGASGRKIVQQITRLTDQLLSGLYSEAAGRHLQTSRPVRTPGLALVAVGGYGRGELNPHSDIDLLILYGPKQFEVAKALSNEVLYPLWDLKLAVGHSVRTVADCVEVGLADLSAQTCMMESRLLIGDKALYGRFVREFTNRVVRKDVSSFLYQKLEEQRARHERYGETVFLQQPNIKESPGGLRDIHALIWAATARYGTGSLRELAEQGVLAPQDRLVLAKARGFLWRLRNDLHFTHGKRMDVLNFEEQLRVSERFGFEDSRTARGVERFMRQYYRYASLVLDIYSRFIDRSMSRSFGETLSGMIFARKVPPYFTLTNRDIRVDSGKEEAFARDGVGVMNLFHLAQVNGLRLRPETVEALSHMRPSGRSLRSREACEIFMNILRWDSGIAETLSRMHRLRVLGKVLPEFARVDRLVTFSQYHKYTVDAHTLYAMQIMESLREADDTYGTVYREVRRKDVLHLAMLLHDLGKWSDRDHCDVGEEMARDVAGRMRLTADETELLMFLVREHLLMSHIAFRRDLSDPAVLHQFVRRVETTERLKMLYVLTHVDIRAVGPGTWNNWKDGLLTELYGYALEALAGRTLVRDKAATISRARERLVESFGAEARDWLEETLNQLPGRYLMAHNFDELVVHLNMVRQLRDRVAQVEIVPHEDGTADITVCARDHLVPGLFSRIAGTLTAKDLEVLDARITTFRDDVILDVFRVKDPTASGPIDPHRCGRIRQALLDTLEGRVEVEALFAGGHGRVSYEGIAFSHTEPLVRIDNETSDSFTVIDIFAADRQGLLYRITRALAELGLGIFFSRIATKADQVVDVFYVKGEEGKKITDPERIRFIRDALMAVITEHQGVEV